VGRHEFRNRLRERAGIRTFNLPARGRGLNRRPARRPSARMNETDAFTR
jgi:hypothetical protein